MALAAFKLWVEPRYLPSEMEADRAPFFQPLTEEQLQLAERIVKTLPEDPNGAGA